MRGGGWKWTRGCGRVKGEYYRGSGYIYRYIILCGILIFCYGSRLCYCASRYCARSSRRRSRLSKVVGKKRKDIGIAKGVRYITQTINKFYERNVLFGGEFEQGCSNRINLINKLFFDILSVFKS